MRTVGLRRHRHAGPGGGEPRRGGGASRPWVSAHAQADIARRASGLRYWMAAFRPQAGRQLRGPHPGGRVRDAARRARMEVNGRAVGAVAAAARDAGARLVHVSTDYVFDGAAREPYRRGRADRAALGLRQKRSSLGERAALAVPGALVVRTSWLFGPGGANFVATMARLVRRRQPPAGGRRPGERPTYTRFLARALCDLARLEAPAIVHYRNREPVRGRVSGCAGDRRALLRDRGARVEPVDDAPSFRGRRGARPGRCWMYALRIAGRPAASSPGSGG